MEATIPGKPRRQAPPRNLKTKRVCAGEGCGTVLSRYNTGKYCNGCDNPRDVALPTLHATRK